MINEALRQYINEYVSSRELQITFEVDYADKGKTEFSVLLYDRDGNLFYEFPSIRADVGTKVDLKGFKLKLDDPNYIRS